MAINRQDPGEKAKYKTFGKVLFDIVLVVTSFIIGLLIIELLIRVTLPIYDPSGHFEFHHNADGVPLGTPYFKGRQWKNTGDYNVSVEINGYGLRDHKDLKKSNASDIFVVGDSFAFGWGVPEEKRFSNVLQQLIHVPVFNIAIPGNLHDYYNLVKYARKHGAVIKRLIVSICMENDLINYEQTAVSYKPSSKFTLTSIKEYLTADSATYNMLTTLIHRNEYLENLAASLGIIVKNLAGISIIKYDPAVLNSSLNQVKKIIAGTHAVILIVPSRGLWVGNNIKTVRKVHDAFVALLKSSHIPVVDMRPIFEASGNPLQFHFRNDGHWNELGHAVAAEALAKYFSTKKSN